MEEQTVPSVVSTISEPKENNVVEEKDVGEVKNIVTEEKDVVEEKNTVTEEKNTVTEEKNVVTEEKKDIVTEEKNIVTEEKKDIVVTQSNPGLDARIKKQVEFWFSDSNYARDMFLKSTCEKDDGWFPVATLLTFNRMKNLTRDQKVLVEACKESNELIFNEDSTKVKRTRAPPAPNNATSQKRTIYVGHLSEPATGVSIDTLEDFFSKFGKVLCVRIHKPDVPTHAFIEFSTEDEATAVIEKSKVEPLSWSGGVTLKIDRPGPPTNKRKAETVNKREDNQKDRNQRSEQPCRTKPVYCPGRLVRVKNLPQALDRDDLKAFLSKFGKVDYVDQREELPGCAMIRFGTAESAAQASADIAGGSITYKEQIIDGYALAAEEDEKYWTERILPYVNNSNKGRSKRQRR